MTPDDFRAWRAALGWSQTQAAAELRVTPLTVKRWEAGTSPIPGPITRLMELLRRIPGVVVVAMQAVDKEAA